MSTYTTIQPDRIDSVMTEQLSGVTVVIIIACGVLAFILLFILAKRQIVRFSLRSRRGPHMPIGHEANKVLRREIERRIDIIPRIIYEPQLIQDDDPRYILQPGTQLPSHYFRLRAVDDVKLLEKEITKQDSTLKRHPSENLRSYLLSTLAIPMNGLSQKLVHQYCDLYEHARYDPSEFGDEEYQVYSRLLLKLMDIAKLLKSYPNSRKTSPSRTPIKKSQERYRSLLESTKLKTETLADEEVLCVSEKDTSSASLPVSPSENTEDISL